MQYNYNLKNKNSLALPICGKHFLPVRSTNDIKNHMDNAVWRDNEKIILGGGTNVFFTQNYPGIVIYPQFFGIKILEDSAQYIKILFAASEAWDDCVKYCVSNNYFGIENLSGIPGTIGASPVQNIGAYGAELANTFDHAHIIDLATGQENIIYKDECKFAYRDSIFKHKYEDKKIISAVCLKLHKQFAPNLSYHALAEHFHTDQITINAANIRIAVLNIRQSKLPCPSEIPNAGSFFKNPIITKDQYQSLQLQFPDIPQFNYKDNFVKVPAGWLIEKSGLKGFKHNRVGTHKHHALVLINHSNGTAQELQELIKIITDKVNNNFGILLEPEVRII
jgi:UDP-N-acetylmuramate dehydrogenase